ncbi:MAG: GyrI-like domain-containing protein, partial [Spirochaetaceae bacterium]|nr:GyrI-like domain-containing protein [Spirochaetaceae bacterium]
YFEYTVYPLEGLWNLSEKGRNSEELLKDELLYTIMIRQPDFVNQDVFDRAFEIAKKKDVPFLEAAYLTDIEDGLSVSMLHKGSFDTEKVTFDIMKEFIKENNILFSNKKLVHREIYLSDARRSKPENLKTILRYRNLG